MIYLKQFFGNNRHGEPYAGLCECVCQSIYKRQNINRSPRSYSLANLKTRDDVYRFRHCEPIGGSVCKSVAISKLITIFKGWIEVDVIIF